MKKLFCVIAAAVLMMSCFAGCGNDNDKDDKNNAMSNVSEAASDAVSGAENIVDDLTDGTVTDGDGIIGNDEDRSGVSDNTDNNNNNDVSGNDNDNDNNTNATNASEDLM